MLMKETDQKREKKRTYMNKLPATFMLEERERKRKQKSPIWKYFSLKNIEQTSQNGLK